MIHPSGEGRLYPLQPPCEISCSLAGFPYLTAHLVVQQIQRSGGRADAGSGDSAGRPALGPGCAAPVPVVPSAAAAAAAATSTCVMGLGWLLMLRGTEQWIRAVATAVSF